MTIPRLTAAALPALLLAALLPLLAGCGDAATPSTPAAPGPDDVLMTIDGNDIRFGEVQPLVDYLSANYPEVGRKTRMQIVLEKHMVPVALARRAFATERAACRKQAEDLRSVATNAYELDEQNVPHSERRQYARMQPPLAVSMFLFDQLTTGQASAPIELPRGFVVAAAHQYVETPMTSEDMVEATQVGYFTHDAGQWKEWIEQEQARVADKITYVHPDYREALPKWCIPPR